MTGVPPPSADAELAAVRRHVSRGRDLLDRQTDLIRRMRDNGGDTFAAERLMVLMKQAQLLHEEHLDRLLIRQRS